MSLSIAMPVGGIRGAGLGNQIFPVAKAWLAAAELDQHFVDVPWALNPRGYRTELKSSRFDVVGHAVARRLGRPQVVDTEAILRTNEWDYALAIRELVSQGKLDPRKNTLHTSGMAGGYLSIAAARPYLRERFLGTEVATRNRLNLRLSHVRLNSPVVGVHLRSGDFGLEPPEPGTFNARLPKSWYLDVVTATREQMPDAHFVFATEPDAVGVAHQVASEAGLRRFDVTAGRTTADLAALVQADLLVASVSSFSMLAAFLGEMPYIWYPGQLVERDGKKSIWGDDLSRSYGELRPRIADNFGLTGLGLPFVDSAALRKLTQEATRRWLSRHPDQNLVYYGELS